ncbi:MAG: hypothetical protein N2515_06735, partial [Deltaproteobacteria bacterium]|nr:hypothetical protein [Deltaproteobacteria bacterium]
MGIQLIGWVFCIWYEVGWVRGVRADRVVLYAVDGRAQEEKRRAVEGVLRSALLQLGHVVIDAAQCAPDRPQRASEFDGSGLACRGDYVVVPAVDPAQGGYRLHLFVGWHGRLETLHTHVDEEGEVERIKEILRAMLRPE